MIIRPPHVLLDKVYADNCEAQTGAQYGYTTDKIITERRAPQAHIHRKKGWVRERHFWALDLDCDLVWPQKPS